jgi:hypothetical protein
MKKLLATLTLMLFLVPAACARDTQMQDDMSSSGMEQSEMKEMDNSSMMKEETKPMKDLDMMGSEMKDPHMKEEMKPMKDSGM